MKTNNISKKQSFDKERLFSIIRKFNFPRLAGSEGEKKAVDLTIDIFKKTGFTENEIKKQSFNFSDFYSTTLVKIIMTISLTAMLMLVLIVYIYPISAFFIIGLMTLIVFLIFRGLKHPEVKGFWGEYFGKTFQASNVFVKMPALSIPSNEAGDIIISAHLDSKSQSFKTAWRIFIYRTWLYGGVFLGIFYISLLIYNLGVIPIEPIFIKIGSTKILLINLFIWPLTGFVSIANIALMFLNTHNRSSGALDNASGMSIVFELASYFKKNGSLNNFNLWFCQFSAEELGTMGSRIFVNEYEKDFVKGRIFQLNIDMLSAKGKKKNHLEYLKSYGIFPRKKISPLLSKYLEKAAKEDNIKIKGFHLSTGAHLDSVPFHLRGFDAIDLTTRAAAIYSHTELDTPDKVDPNILYKGCIIIRKVVEMLDNDFNKLCNEEKIICES